MSDRAIKLFGTEEPVPEQRRLTAGPITATFEDGQLRWIKLGDAEVIRAIAFLIRDRNWSTCPPAIENLQIEEQDGGFRVSFDALTRTIDGDLTWHGEFRGTPDGTIHCEGIARPEQDFLTCRTGFVILHPLEGVVGRPMTIEHVDGTVEETRAPELIDRASVLSLRARDDPRAPAGRARDPPHGGRRLGDRGPSQLDGCLVQDLLPSARTALAVHGCRRDRGPPHGDAELRGEAARGARDGGRAGHPDP